MPESADTTGVYREYPTVDKDQASAHPYPYVYINVDGTARELHPAEREYLETPFHPTDGGRPYTKQSYPQTTPAGKINGFLKRANLPSGTQIHAAPEENPCKTLTLAEHLQDCRNRGCEVIDMGNGQYRIKAPKRPPAV